MSDFDDVTMDDVVEATVLVACRVCGQPLTGVRVLADDIIAYCPQHPEVQQDEEK